jgi:hypothetical protein
MAGIKDYSTTQASNTSLNGINVAEGMLPSNLNNAIRALMKNTRDWFNDAQWIEYGDGDASYTAAYASATSFTIAGVDVTSVYHTGRRIKLVAATPGTIYGTISSSSFSTNTTVNVTWDSGSLSNEAITSVYIGSLSKTNSSIPEGVVATSTLADGSVTTAKLADASVTNAKLATSSVATGNIQTSAVTEAKIASGAVTNTKLGDASVTTAKITDANVTTAKIADSNVTTAKIAADAINGSKIADDSIDSEHYVDGSIDTAHIGDSQITTAKVADSNITTAKINDDAVTAAKIADAVIVTNAEASAHTPDDVTFFTTSASDGRYFRQDSSETISSGDTWSASDSYVATTAAIDARVVDLVDDVGGFYPIENETSFPNTNPDVNDGAGTIISIKEIATTRTPTAGTVTIASGTLGGSTVTITGCGSTVLTAGFGVLVETTSTLNTYAFHRLVPKATEVTTVASISSDITTVAGNTSNINTVAGNSANITTVAGISGNVTTVAGISADVTAVAGDATDIGTVATDLAGSDNIGTVAGSISNVNNVGGSITNVNTVATNLADVNNFAEVYRISASAPTTSLDVGDLYFDTTANELKVYKASGWAAAGSTVNGTSARFTYTISGTPTTVSGTDDFGNTLAYDSPYVDIFLNGSKQVNGTDVTVTSGTSVVFATALSDGDIVDVVAYGTFSVAAIDASNITSGTLNAARIGSASIDLTTKVTGVLPYANGGTGLSSLGSAGQALKVNSGGTALEFGDVSVSLSYTKGTFTGDNSTTDFTIDSGRAVDDVLVYVNGFLLTPTSDYTISGTTLTFVTAPATSAEIVVRYLPLNNSGVYTNDTSTGDNSTVDFTIDSGRTVEDVIVTVNGVTLVPATDYTISGTTLTFTTAPTTSAEISIRYLRLT